MSDPILHAQIEELEDALNNATPAARLEMRAEVKRIIEALHANDQPIPQKLKHMKRHVDPDGDDDFFDNMPV